MKIVKIKMLRNFVDDHSTISLHKGSEYYAIDGGDYWLAQRYLDGGFVVVVPKKVVPTTYIIYAEVVPTHTDEESPEPGCCPGPNGE